MTDAEAYRQYLIKFLGAGLAVAVNRARADGEFGLHERDVATLEALGEQMCNVIAQATITCKERPNRFHERC